MNNGTRTWRNGMWLVVAASLCMATSARSAEATVYPEKSVEFPNGCPTCVSIESGRIVLSNSWSRGDGLLSIDARKPENLKYNGGVRALGYPFSHVRKGGFIYVPAWFSLMVVDAEHGEGMRIARSLLIDFSVRSRPAYRAFIRKNNLFVAGKSGVRVFDISIPDSPVLKTFIPEAMNVENLIASNDKLILFSRKRMKIIDLTTRSILSETAIPWFKQIASIDDVLYALTRKGILQLWDLKNPANPRLTNKIENITNIKRIDGKRINALSKNGKLLVLKCDDPLNPVVEKKIDLPKNLNYTDVDYDKNTMCVWDAPSTLVATLDVSGTKAKLLDSISISRSEGAVSLSESGKEILTSTSSGRKLDVYALRLNGPAIQSPAPMYTANLAKKRFFRVYDVFPATAMKRIGDYLMIGDGMLELSDGGTPNVIREMSKPAAVVKRLGNRLCVLLKDELVVEDISRLPTVREIAKWSFDPKKTAIKDIELSGNTIFLLHGRSISARTLPTARPIPHSALKGIPNAVSFLKVGDFLYIPTFSDPKNKQVLAIVDVSDPRNPRMVKKIENLINRCRLIKKYGDKLYLIDNQRGIKELSINDPLNPKISAVYNVDPYKTSVYSDFEARDGKLYGRRYSGVDIWRLKDGIK